MNKKNDTHGPCLSKVPNVGGVLFLEMFHQIGNCACFGRKFKSRAFASIFSLRLLEIRLLTVSGSMSLRWQ